MPEEFLIEFIGLSHEGAYTSRCQMPEFEQEKMMDLFRWVMVCILVTIQTRSDLLIRIGMSRFVMEGMLEGVYEVQLLSMMAMMVPPYFFTPNPVPQYSWFHQTIPNTPSSVLLLLCAIHNSLLNRLTFPA